MQDHETKTEPPKGISLRPSKALRPKVSEMAAQLDKSEGEFAIACLRAVIGMIEADDIAVPQLVMMARTLRAQKMTMLDQPTHFPGVQSRDIKEVSNGYPAHKIPLYPRITAGPPVEGLGEVEEWIDVPAGRFRYVDFAVRVEGDSMTPGIKPGTIALFVKAPTAENTQVVAAYFPKKGQVCLKRFKANGKKMLVSDNPTYAPIDASEAQIQGIFVGSM